MIRYIIIGIMEDKHLTTTPVALNLTAEIAGFIGQMADPGTDSRFLGDYPENLLKYDPYSMQDLLKVHSDLMYGIDNEAGDFRTSSLGVYIDDELVHAGSRTRDIEQLMQNLLDWASRSEVHPLVKGIAVRFWIEYIQPFNRGSSEIAGIWQAIIHRQWKDVFSWLPLEEAVNNHRQEYDESLVASYRGANPGTYVECVLRVIYDTLKSLPENRVVDLFSNSRVGELSQLDREFLEKISTALDNRGEVTNRQAQELTGLSGESVKKYFARLVEVGLLEARGEKKGRKYILSNTK